jgi:pimeloyl-ACP methyl ester carboxylesterase
MPPVKAWRARYFTLLWDLIWWNTIREVAIWTTLKSKFLSLSIYCLNSKYERRKSMTTFLLVHGAWLGGWSYKRVAEKLRKNGHVVYTPTNTGLGERSHLFHPDIDLDTHVQDIVNVIQWEELDDFALVGHSYGGMIITAIADRFPEKVRRLVYLDGFLPENRKCEMDYLPEEQVAAMREDAAANNNGIHPIPAEAFHVNEKDAVWVNSMCVRHPNEPPRRKRRGINRKILNAPRGGELNPRTPQAD